MVPVVEAVGDTVTLKIEHFRSLKGQTETTFDKSATEIDLSDKVSGNWGESVVGTVSMSVSVNGYVVWPGTTDWKPLNDIVDSGSVINCKLLLNQAGDYYLGPFTVSSQTGGGGVNDGNAYSFTLANAGRPLLITA